MYVVEMEVGVRLTNVRLLRPPGCAPTRGPGCGRPCGLTRATHGSRTRSSIRSPSGQPRDGAHERDRLLIVAALAFARQQLAEELPRSARNHSAFGGITLHHGVSKVLRLLQSDMRR